jgi:ATP-dependent Lhr-like helicase
MYADDAPEQSGRSALSDDLIRQAVFDQSLRPAIAPAVIADFEARAQRTRAGYVPEGETELGEWVKERVAIPLAEWFEDAPVPAGVARRIVGGREFLVHREVVLGEDPVREIGEMLQFYGPRTAEQFADLLPFVPSAAYADFAAVLAELQDARTLVRGPLVLGSAAETVCDADNLETLIRFQRAAARPAFAARPAAALTPFLANWHGFGAAPSPERLLDAVERLRGYRAPVPFWQDEALPPRQGASMAMESAAAEGLVWRGCGADAAMIGFGEDLDLLGQLDQLDQAETEDPAPVLALFKDPSARYTFTQLLDESDMDTESFNAVFWEAVWAGRIAADGFAPLAAGHARRYRLHDAPPLRDSEARMRSARWRARARARGAALGWPGTWYRVPPAPPPDDALARLEETKERCRMLLDRYGILTREHANREGGALRWAAVFPALRVMELSGEIVAGLFFESFSGPQFALPRALRQLERYAAGDGETFWINALDPVSPCGLGTALPDLPQRRLANHLGYCEGKLAVVSENHAKRLTIFLEPDDPHLDALLAHLVPMCRARRRLLVQAINARPVAASPYLPALSRHLKPVTDHKGVYFEAPR